MIVIALCSLLAGGASLAGDRAVFGTDRDGSEIGRPGNGPGHEFVDRVNDVLARFGLTIGSNRTERLFGGYAGSCLFCPTIPPVVEEQPLPDPRPNKHRPQNRGTRTSSGTWISPR